MLRNNADARRCSYFELGLPVIFPDVIFQTDVFHLSFQFQAFAAVIWEMELIFTKSKREFCVPFAQTVNRPDCPGKW